MDINFNILDINKTDDKALNTSSLIKIDIGEFGLYVNSDNNIKEQYQTPNQQKEQHRKLNYSFSNGSNVKKDM